MNDDFIDWLTSEMDIRGWNNSELARQAKLVPSTISMIISRHNRPGYKFCVAIAEAFQLPQDTVLRRAGLAARGSNTIEMDDESKEMLHLFQQLGTKERKLMLVTLRAWREASNSRSE